MDRFQFMKEFYQTTHTIGTIPNPTVYHPLEISLYDELKPKKEIQKIKDIVDDIEDKTIFVMKKSDNPLLLPDAKPDAKPKKKGKKRVDTTGEQDEIDESVETVEPDETVETDKTDEIDETDETQEGGTSVDDIDILEGGSPDIKRITIQKDYVVSDQ